MKLYHLLLMFAFIFAFIGSSPTVNAIYSISTNKSYYNVGDTITVNVCTEGGRIGVTMSGPYTINVNLGDLSAGCYSFTLGQAEQKDVGSWTVVMTNDSSVPSGRWQMSYAANPPKAYFTVSPGVPEFPLPAVTLGIALAGLLIITKSRKRVFS